MNSQANIRKLMQTEFLEAQARNSGFSLRAFSKRIGLYSSTVSEILSGRRPITKKMALRILQGLNKSPVEIESVLREYEKSSPKTKATYSQIDMDQFHVISDWYYFAILSLADTDHFKDDPIWVAKRLNIKIQQARIALERLERLEMLQRNSKGRLVATNKQFKTSEDIANISLRKHHFQNLELAGRSLEKDAVLEREFTFITMAADPALLPQIKKRIRDFRDELCKEFESARRKEVYKLCIQLFPLTQSQKFGEKK